MTFSLNIAEWKRLARVAFTTSATGKRGIVCAIVVLAISPVAFLALQAWIVPVANDPADARTLCLVFTAFAALLVAAAIVAHSWYAANGYVGMRKNQAVQVDTAGTLTYSFHVRGDCRPGSRNVATARLGHDVSYVTYDQARGLITLYGTVWVGISQNGEAPSWLGPLAQYTLPNCFVPDLVGELSRRCAVRLA